MTFSIIIPVYNTEKYLNTCLDSISKQSYASFEVIVVNDGSTDSSQDIIDSYVKRDKRFKSIIQKNQGQSVARNKGISESQGEYLVFVDSDDYLKEDALEQFASVLDTYPSIDLIKYQLMTLNEGIEKVHENPIFESCSGEEAFNKLIKTDMFVTPVSYVYRRAFWIENGFTFASGRVHEDFGLIPYVVIKSSSICSISYTGYVYVIRPNSTMTDQSIEKLNKKNEDVLYHFDALLSMINQDTTVSLESKKIFRSYIANALLTRCTLLKGNVLKEYIQEMKDRNISVYLLEDTFMRKIKKILFHYFPSLYIFFFVR